MKSLLLALAIAVPIVNTENIAKRMTLQARIEQSKERESFLRQKSREQFARSHQPKPKKATKRVSRGGMGERVTCFITYYTNENSPMEGGQYDKNSRLLTSHGVPVVAMPKDVPYGATLVLDQALTGHSAIKSSTFKVVDTGGAIRWKNGGVKVDVFVPNVTPQWIERNLKNKTIQGYLWR